MNLTQYLASEPQAYLRGLARQLALPAAAAAGAQHGDLAAALAEHLKAPTVLARTIGSLNEAERAALKVITFAGGGRGIVMEQCHQRINQIMGRRRRNGAQVVAVLMGKGLVFVGRFHYRQHYLIPADLQGMLAVLFGRELLDRVAWRPDRASASAGVGGEDGGHEVLEDASDSYALIRWVCQFLSYCRKNRVELTQAGTIYRRTQRRLMQMMGQEEAAEEEPQSEGGVAGGGAGTAAAPASALAHPEPLDFVLSYCRGRGLAEQKGGALVPSSDARPWMEAPLWDRRRDLLLFWREARLAWDMDVQAVLSVLLSLPAGTWVDLAALFRELEPMATDLYRGTMRRRLGQRVIRHLVLQGLLVLGTAGEEQVCRLTPMGRALLTGGDEPVADVATERKFFVQPNFELLIPSRIDTDLLWRIEECADLEKPDWMMVYRLTRASVYRALTLGRSPEELSALLEEHSLNELPQNVSFSIRDWPAAFGRLWFARSYTLHCDTPALAGELVASSSVGRFVRGRLSPTVLVIDRAELSELMQVLETEGYMPAPGVRRLSELDWDSEGRVRVPLSAETETGGERTYALNRQQPEQPEQLEQLEWRTTGQTKTAETGQTKPTEGVEPLHPAAPRGAAGTPRRSRPGPGRSEPAQQ
jgi:hypothetical protein